VGVVSVAKYLSAVQCLVWSMKTQDLGYDYSLEWFMGIYHKRLLI